MNLEANQTLSDSGFAAGIGVASIKEKMYLTTNVYLPNTEAGVDYLLIDVSPHYRLNKHIYAGVSIGYQKHEETDDESVTVLNANESTIDLSGLTAGISVGLLSASEKLDINLKINFKNGDDDALSGQVLGESFEFRAEMTKTILWSLGYNF